MSKAAFALTLALALVPGAARADVVLDWNEILLDAIRVDRTNPPRAGRAMACAQLAVFDAVNGLLGGFAPYHVTDAAPAGASAEAAGAAAAHRVLATLFPAQQTTFDAALAASLAAIPDGASETDGVAWGRDVADAILALRAADGSDDVRDYEYPAGANWWTPTPPGFAPALLPNWPLVTPFAMTHGAQFRQLAPPVPNTAEYASSFREVRRLGRVDSQFRTPDQSEIAVFWVDGPGTVTPPGHWHVIAQGLSTQAGLTLIENARLFALLGIASADAAIVSWDNKYAYSNWRPVTGIQAADTDGNPETVADPGWTSFIPTPPFPSYTSGHSTFSGSSARVLGHFFGSDAIAFTTSSDALPGVERSFTSLAAAAEEAGQSRIYGGIHWQFDNQAALASGRELGDHIFFNFLTPQAAPGTCAAGATALCLDDRFQVEAQWRTADASGAGQAVADTSDSGRFWFFAADNTEVVVKVLRGCETNDRFWVFASGLTDVEVRITVTDTQVGRVRRYFNPLGRAFAPVQDTSAFATCL